MSGRGNSADSRRMGAEQRACDLLAETALFDELGLGQLAARARTVARDVLELVGMLAAERSARVAMQAERDRTRDLLMRGTGVIRGS